MFNLHTHTEETLLRYAQEQCESKASFLKKMLAGQLDGQGEHEFKLVNHYVVCKRCHVRALKTPPETNYMKRPANNAGVTHGLCLQLGLDIPPTRYGALVERLPRYVRVMPLRQAKSSGKSQNADTQVWSGRPCTNKAPILLQGQNGTRLMHRKGAKKKYVPYIYIYRVCCQSCLEIIRQGIQKQ